MRIAILSLLALAASLSPAPAQDPGADQLAITRIVLYKHGVGYFEREGTVRGDATVPLSFKTAQMKDVLKSLYAIDLGGGRISTILYDSKDPIQKQLEDILFRVPEGSALTQFLAQLKGARVRANVGATPTTGHVLGIEPVQQTTASGILTAHKLVLLRDDGAIAAVDVLDASSIEILDETVRADLARMMDIYAKARYADRKVVHLRASGIGERKVRAGYIIETPIWKTSYRLLLDATGAPLLQGWAIVENRTDEDWNDVHLSFVAGSPQSFVLDLYTSYYPERPVVGMGQGLTAETARMARPGPAGPSTPGPAGPVTGAAPMRKARGRAEAPGEDGGATLALGEALEMSNVTAAQGVAVGDLFSYEASGPVTIKQNQAALVPILLERLPKSERALYFRADLARYPHHAVLIDNTTSLTLEKGPVTVFEGSTCLGEALLTKTLKAGMHEMLTYALETAVEVEVRGHGKTLPITRSVLVNGLLTMYYREARETTYKLRNKAGKGYALFVDHAKAGGPFELVQPAKAHEELLGHLRFKIDLAKDAAVDLVVREEREASNAITILDQSAEGIRVHLQQRYLSEAARTLLVEVAELVEQRAAIERELKDLQQESARLTQEQDTMRRNMGALRDSPEERRLRDQYVERLTRALTRTDELEKLLATANENREQLTRRLNDKVRGFRE